MPSHEFALILAGTPTVEQTDALVGLPDHPLVERRPRAGTGRIVFTRECADATGAVVSAISDLRALGLRPLRVVHGDWVTLADIAQRLDRSREAIRLWSLGRVGPGGFPPPLNPGCDTLFYSWVEVSTWCRERMRLPLTRPDPGLVAADLAIRLRLLAPRVRRMELLDDLLP